MEQGAGKGSGEERGSREGGGGGVGGGRKGRERKLGGVHTSIKYENMQEQ